MWPDKKRRKEIADTLAIWGVLFIVTVIVLTVLAILAGYQLVRRIKGKKGDRWI